MPPTGWSGPSDREDGTGGGKLAQKYLPPQALHRDRPARATAHKHRDRERERAGGAKKQTGLLSPSSATSMPCDLGDTVLREPAPLDCSEAPMKSKARSVKMVPSP